MKYTYLLTYVVKCTHYFQMPLFTWVVWMKKSRKLFYGSCFFKQALLVSSVGVGLSINAC